jgi:hypothetical protein
MSLTAICLLGVFVIFCFTLYGHTRARRGLTLEGNGFAPIGTCQV